MAKALEALRLTKHDREFLQGVLRRTTISAGYARRARILLLAADGQSSRQIGFKVGCKAHVVGEWRRRYLASGLEGIKDRARSGRPTKISAAQKQRVVTKVCAAPPRHLARWSVRTLAAEVKLPASVVHLILQKHDLHPHRLRTFNFSPDPHFENKLLDVVGIYMRPPRNAVVLCVNEKTGIQALDRTQPMLPRQAGKPRTWSNEYVRHGTRTMLAALQVKTGGSWRMCGTTGARRPFWNSWTRSLTSTPGDACAW